jgi:hypothetical protein
MDFHDDTKDLSAQVRTAVREWRCARCGRRPRNEADVLLWNQTYINGRPVNQLCPEHQTPQETAEAEQNAAERAGYFHVCEARLLPGPAFRRICRLAIEKDVPGPTAEYLERCGHLEHLVVLAFAGGTYGVVMAFPFDATATEFVGGADGEDMPLVSVADFAGGPNVIVEMPLAKFVGAPKVLVREGWLQEQVTKQVCDYLGLSRN